MVWLWYIHILKYPTSLEWPIFDSGPNFMGFKVRSEWSFKMKSWLSYIKMHTKAFRIIFSNYLQDYCVRSVQCPVSFWICSCRDIGVKPKNIAHRDNSCKPSSRAIWWRWSILPWQHDRMVDLDSLPNYKLKWPSLTAVQFGIVACYALVPMASFFKIIHNRTLHFLIFQFTVLTRKTCQSPDYTTEKKNPIQAVLTEFISFFSQSWSVQFKWGVEFVEIH